MVGLVIHLAVTDALVKWKVFANFIVLCKLYENAIKEFLFLNVLQVYHICLTFLF